MKQLTMRYKGFAFPVNPGEISLTLSRNIRTEAAAFRRVRVSDTGKCPCTVSGSGCFFGEDAEEQAYRLMTVFQSEGAAWLYAPSLPPMRMFFQSLQIYRSADKQCVQYRFSFTEATPLKQHTRQCRYTYVRENETLFDVANRTGIAVEELAQRNCVKDLFSLGEGDKLWLN